MAATVGTLAQASSDSDPLGCEALVFDPNGVLAASTIESARAQTATRLGADVRVRVEGTLDGGLEVRWTQLRRQCDGWEVDGDVAPDLVVMMFSTSEREASVYYGADQGPALESRWSGAVDAMTAQFADEDYTQGVGDGLSTLRGAPPLDVSFSPAPPSNRGRNGSIPPFVVVIGLIALVVLVAVSKANGWSSSGDGSSWSSNSSNRRSSSLFSSSGAGRSRTSSRSRRSSGGGSRRSGGGTKKW